jgi:hypothetical protein
VTLSEVEGRACWRNPERLCEGSLNSVSRLSIALICYVVLGALTWATITDPKLRAGTLVILVLFAVKSVLRRRDVLHVEEDKASESETASVEVAES